MASARNLKLWTNYRGTDPETDFQATVDNDVPSEFQTFGAPTFFVVPSSTSSSNHAHREDMYMRHAFHFGGRLKPAVLRGDARRRLLELLQRYGFAARGAGSGPHPSRKHKLRRRVPWPSPTARWQVARRDGGKRKHLAVRRPARRRMGHELDVHPERRGGLAPGSGEQCSVHGSSGGCIACARRRIRRSRCSRTWEPTRTALIGEMYFARGFAELQLASDFCNGIPLSDGAEDRDRLRRRHSPVSDVFTTAIASFDAALAAATGTDAASVRVQRAARVGKARAQLGNNQFAAAAATIVGPPAFRRISVIKRRRRSPRATTSSGARGSAPSVTTVADCLEGNSRNLLVRNAIPFFSANDPRLPVIDTKVVGQDGGTFVRTTTLYDRLTPIDVVNGLDARLIEAEAALRGGNVTQWLQILNDLRQGPTRIAQIGTVVIGATALPLLTDPGTEAERVSLLFREKAFWTFSRGQRLGDLRRLVRQFGRTAGQRLPGRTALQDDSVRLRREFPDSPGRDRPTRTSRAAWTETPNASIARASRRGGASRLFVHSGIAHAPDVRIFR